MEVYKDTCFAELPEDARFVLLDFLRKSLALKLQGYTHQALLLMVSIGAAFRHADISSTVDLLISCAELPISTPSHAKLSFNQILGNIELLVASVVQKKEGTRLRSVMIDGLQDSIKLYDQVNPVSFQQELDLFPFLNMKRLLKGSEVADLQESYVWLWSYSRLGCSSVEFFEIPAIELKMTAFARSQTFDYDCSKLTPRLQYRWAYFLAHVIFCACDWGMFSLPRLHFESEIVFLQEVVQKGLNAKKYEVVCEAVYALYLLRSPLSGDAALGLKRFINNEPTSRDDYTSYHITWCRLAGTVSLESGLRPCHPQRCFLCGASFVQTSGRNRHLKKVHFLQNITFFKIFECNCVYLSTCCWCISAKSQYTESMVDIEVEIEIEIY
jgi:hypothetical protein